MEPLETIKDRFLQNLREDDIPIGAPIITIRDLRSEIRGTISNRQRRVFHGQEAIIKFFRLSHMNRTRQLIIGKKLPPTGQTAS